MVLIRALDHQRKSFVLTLLKQAQNLFFSFYYNADNSYLLFNGKEIFEFQTANKNVNFPIQFCLGSISNGFSATESSEVSLNGDVFDFSVDYNSIDKSDMLNIHEYLMTKNIIK